MGLFSGIGKIVSSVVDAGSSLLGNISGGDLLKGGLSLLGGIQTNSANSAQASQTEAFQQYNSDTAYQRAMRDMEAAGLNPIMAATNGGASTPSGATPSMSDPITPAITTALQSARTNADLTSASLAQSNTFADTSNKLAQNDLYKAQTAKTIQDTQNSAKSGKSIDINNILDSAGIPSAQNDAKAAGSWYGRHVAPYLPDLLSHSAKAGASSAINHFLP